MPGYGIADPRIGQHFTGFVAEGLSWTTSATDAHGGDAEAGGKGTGGGSAVAGTQAEGLGTQSSSSAAAAASGPSINGFATTADPTLILPDTASTYSNRVDWAPRGTCEMNVGKTRNLKANKELTGKE